MSVNTNINSYLAAKIRQQRIDAQAAREPGTLPFVTVDRQSGAGGYALAEELLSTMEARGEDELFTEWQVFDRKMCEQVLSDKQLTTSMRELLDEHYHGEIGEFVLGVFGQHSPLDTAIHELSRVMRNVAHVGKVVIVGRGASQACKQLSAGLNILLVAPQEVRIERMAERLGIEKKEARQYVLQHDSERIKMLKEHFQIDAQDATMYDAIFNTHDLTLSEIASAVIAMLQHRHRPG